MKVAGGKWEWGVINFFFTCLGWGGGVEKIWWDCERVEKNLVTQIKLYPTPPPPHPHPHHTHTHTHNLNKTDSFRRRKVTLSILTRHEFLNVKFCWKPNTLEYREGIYGWTDGQSSDYIIGVGRFWIFGRGDSEYWGGGASGGGGQIFAGCKLSEERPSAPPPPLQSVPNNYISHIKNW